jgi:hypothetical protein
MTRSDDEILHGALSSEAGTAMPPANGFDEVRAAAQGKGHSRRLVVFGIAAAVVVALGVGGAVAATRDDDNRVNAGPDDSVAPVTTIAPTSPTTSIPPQTTTLPETTTVPETTTTTTAPFTGSTLPPPSDVAGYTPYRTVGLETLEPAYREEAASPQAKVDELVAFLRDEPIEGRKGAEGAVNSIQGNRAQVEVRVLGVASDSHAGFDYRLYLLQEAPGGSWKVVAAEVRDLCSRAYDGSVCV